MPPRINVGDIWQVSLDDTEGHEQRGERPALVLAVHREANVVMVTPLTGNLEALRFPYSHEVKRSRNNGLSRDSAALIYQTRCLTSSRFIRKIGEMEPTDMGRVKSLLENYLSL